MRGAPTTADMAAEFTAEHDMPGRARRLVVAVLEQCGHDEILLGDAALVLSELASNAVLHARSPFSVAVRTKDSMLRIAVSDSAPLLSGLRDGGLIPRSTHDCTYPMPSAIVKASSCAAVAPASRMW